MTQVRSHLWRVGFDYDVLRELLPRVMLMLICVCDGFVRGSVECECVGNRDLEYL